MDEEEFIKPSLTFNEEDDFEENVYGDKDEELIEKLKSLDGKKRKRLRTEVVGHELDVNITSNKDGNSVHKIKAYEIINSLKNVPEVGSLKRMFSKLHSRTKVLETPLPKYISEKATRLATYEQDKKEISKWDPVIKKLVDSKQIVFPLKQPDYTMQPASSFTKTWKPETELEKQVAELLESSENNLKDQKLLTPAELKAVEAMNLDEMRQKRAEFLKLKAMQTYQEAKFKRVKKIKSKRYRQILRKEKLKQEEKDLAIIEKDEPLKFKEVLKEMEKKRMKERMSLKHKNTSKWSKKQAIYAKYNDKAREQVQEQLEMSKELTKKVKEFEYDDNDDGEKNENADGAANINGLNASNLLANNPWMKMMSGVGVGGDDAAASGSNENGEEKGDYSKPKAFTNKKEIEKAKKEMEEEDESSDEEEQLDKSNLESVKSLLVNEPTKSLKKSSNDENDEEEDKEKENNQLAESTETISEPKPVEPKLNEDKKQIEKAETESEPKQNKSKDENPPKLNPTTPTPAPTPTPKQTPAPIAKTNEASNKNSKETKKVENSKESHLVNNRRLDDKQHQLTLSEAFADDDVIEEFLAEKKSIVEKEKVKSIDLTMPGWGGWSGAGIDPKLAKKKQILKNKRQGRRLIIRPSDVLTTEEDKQQLIRKDKDLEHVIISEKKDAKIAKYQISELPRQYDNVYEFESKISQPIGRTWNPDHKFRDLIAPKIKTTIGSIIEPIDRDDMIKTTKIIKNNIQIKK